MEKETGYKTMIAVLAVLLIVSIVYTANTGITGKAVEKNVAYVWVKSTQEVDSNIYIDGKLYQSIKQLGRERIDVTPGTHELKVTSELGEYTETITLEAGDQTTVYITYKLQ